MVKGKGSQCVRKIGSIVHAVRRGKGRGSQCIREGGRTCYRGQDGRMIVNVSERVKGMHIVNMLGNCKKEEESVC